jgi:2',3'-cyclic-nucleotide 2'-phosphodiesterase (5'-nucleotidase family)
MRLLHYSDVENVYDAPARAGRLAGLLCDLDGPDALVVGSGDTTAPGVLALVERGHQAVDFFERVGADFDTFGNHEFDYGVDSTRDLVADSPQTWVSANVYDDDGRFAEEAGAVPHAVREVDGERVGVFGVTDPATDSLNPEAAGLTFTDPYEAAAEAVAALSAADVDWLVALSHLGAGDDGLAERFDLDAVLGGHVHTERVDRIDGTTVVRPGVNGEVVLELACDDDGVRVERHETASAPVDRRLADALDGRVAAAGLDEAVGHAPRPMPRDEATVTAGECRVGNFVADAYRHATGADVGLQNSGGIRAGPPLSGEVTLADLVSVVPFAAPVVRAELTGAELLELFRETSAAGVDFGEPDWWHGHLSGATVVWDDAAGELLEARVDGDPVDPEAAYTVGTAEYLLHTDHEFGTLTERHRAGEAGIQHDALLDYATECGLDVRVEGRIRRVGTETGDASPPGAGDCAAGVSDR